MCMFDQGYPVPLSYQEIQSWSQISRVEIEGHEAETIKELSQYYCICWRDARNPNAADPMGVDGELQKKAFADLIKRLEA